jgi:hypothetical protein
VEIVGIDNTTIVYGEQPWTWIHYRVSNAGNEATPAGPIYLRVWRNGSPASGYMTVDGPIQPGDSATSEFAVGHDSGWPVGAYTVQVEVDYLGEIEESDDYNNFSTDVSFEVKEEHPLSSLIDNPSFEQDPRTTETLWFVDRRNTDLTAWWPAETARTGTYALALSASESAQQGWPGWFTTNAIPLAEGYEYTFSAWAYSPDGAGAWTSVDMLDSNGRYVMGFSTGCPHAAPEGSWYQRVIRVSLSDAPGATQVRLGLQQCLNFTEGEKTTLYYDDVYFGISPP